MLILPKPVPFGQHLHSFERAGALEDSAEQFRIEGDELVPCAICRYKEEAELGDEVTRNGLDEILIERIAERVIIVEIPNRVRFQIAVVEAGAEGNLYAKRIRGGLLFGHQLAAGLISPFLYAPLSGKPLAMSRSIIRLEARDGCHQPNAVRSVRVAAKKIMLGKAADEAIPSEQ